MSFLLLIMTLSIVAYGPQWLLGDRRNYRVAMRHGMAGGLIFTGIDHFVSSHSRYVPMLPDFLTDYALGLVYLTGALELAGAIGLVVPLAVYRRLGMPNLRKWAGSGLAVMLALLVMANIHVALEGRRVEGLDFGHWYYAVRPFIQPILMLWALFVSGVLGRND